MGHKSEFASAAMDGAPMACESRRERHRTETRDRIFRAALQLFAERGYLETTVEDITNAADVGKGTFFNYFPTKEHVLASFGDERITEIEKALAHARGMKGPVLPVIRSLVTHLAGQSSSSAALLRSIYAAHASCAPVRAEMQKRVQAARSLLTQMFVLAQERGEVRRDVSAADLGRLMQLVFHGVTLVWALSPDSGLLQNAEFVWELLSPAFSTGGRAKGANRKHADEKD